MTKARKKERVLTGWVHRHDEFGFYVVSAKKPRKDKHNGMPYATDEVSLCPELFHKATDYRLKKGAEPRRVKIRVSVEEI